MYLFFDTETTGLPNYRLPVDHEDQPYICQIGAILTDMDGKVKQELNSIIKPEGWVITKETSDIHGITQEDAENYGIPLKSALEIFCLMMDSSKVMVAHNISFDERMMNRVGVKISGEKFCTMSNSRNIVKASLTEKQVACGFGGYKNPNLQETYTHFFGKPFEGAHDAMADVRACRDVFFKLKELEIEAA